MMKIQLYTIRLYQLFFTKINFIRLSFTTATNLLCGHPKTTQLGQHCMKETKKNLFTKRTLFVFRTNLVVSSMFHCCSRIVRKRHIHVTQQFHPFFGVLLLRIVCNGLYTFFHYKRNEYQFRLQSLFLVLTEYTFLWSSPPPQCYLT